MALATAMVNSPEVFQCLASASLTVVWASAGSDRARNSSRFVFMICLGTISHIAEGAVRANGGGVHSSPDVMRSRDYEPFRPRHNRPHAILVAGEIAVSSTAVGGNSTPLLGIRRRRVEHIHRPRCENRRFGSPANVACAAPSAAAV